MIRRLARRHNNVLSLSPASWRFPSFVEVPLAKDVQAELHTYETLIASRAKKKLFVTWWPVSSYGTSANLPASKVLFRS